MKRKYTLSRVIHWSTQGLCLPLPTVMTPSLLSQVSDIAALDLRALEDILLKSTSPSRSAREQRQTQTYVPCELLSGKDELATGLQYGWQCSVESRELGGFLPRPALLLCYTQLSDYLGLCQLHLHVFYAVQKARESSGARGILHKWIELVRNVHVTTYKLKLICQQFFLLGTKPVRIYILHGLLSWIPHVTQQAVKSRFHDCQSVSDPFLFLYCSILFQAYFCQCDLH